MVRDKFRKLLWPIAGVLLCAVFQLKPGQSAQTTANPAAEKAVRQLIDSLPPKSMWRTMLEHGAKGDGIRRPWMGAMRGQGVRLAVLTFDFDWTHGGDGLKNLKNWRIVSAKYFASYDCWGSRPITDPGQLAAIRAAGLEGTLEPVALARAKAGFWVEDPGHQHPPRTTGTGFATVFLADSPWLPVRMFPWFGQYDPGTTPLMHAAQLGDVTRIKSLLARGADINAVSLDGSTALVYAAAYDSAEAVRTLLEAGADVSLGMKGGGNALTAAVVTNHAKNVALLLKAGADPNSRNAEGQSALSLAIQRHYPEIVGLLKQAGAQK